MSKENTHEQLVEKARTEYGITNADTMSDEQLKSEIKAIDKQREDASKADQA